MAVFVISYSRVDQKQVRAVVALLRGALLGFEKRDFEMFMARSTATVVALVSASTGMPCGRPTIVRRNISSSPATFSTRRTAFSSTSSAQWRMT
jgi:hypothetical protein